MEVDGRRFLAIEYPRYSARTVTGEVAARCRLHQAVRGQRQFRLHSLQSRPDAKRHPGRLLPHAEAQLAAEGRRRSDQVETTAHFVKIEAMASSRHLPQRERLKQREQHGQCRNQLESY